LCKKLGDYPKKKKNSDKPICMPTFFLPKYATNSTVNKLRCTTAEVFKITLAINKVDEILDMIFITFLIENKKNKIYTKMEN
jgi:hypothetical protein